MKTKNICDKNMKFSDCELAILRMQVDQAEEKIKKRVVKSDDVQKMIKIVEEFLKKKQLVCYGGISINALLPDEDKIYNEDIDIPDYDFFSPNALEDAKELADLYVKEGYTEVEAKSGQHHGTYKVFVNFQGVADITYISKELFRVIKSKSVQVDGILYTDPTFLRMSMYLELSRPAGDTSRWEKVLKRLTLINKHYPLSEKQCTHIDFQREIGDKKNVEEERGIYDIVRNTLVGQEVVFFGGYAISQYSQYMPKPLRKKLEEIPDFDVIARDPKKIAEIVKEELKKRNIKDVKIIKRKPVDEIIPLHYEVKVGLDSICFIYEPVACHSYNVLMINKKKVRIATIDTMLSFYLSFLYSNREYYDPDRILCMAKFLFDVQQKNRLQQKGLLKRFSITCYGHQPSIEEMKAEKAEKFKELKADSSKQKEYEEWFFNYRPIIQTDKTDNKKTTSKKRSKSKSSKLMNPYNQKNNQKVKKTNKTKKNRNKFVFW